jgi:hypothetical protein
MWRHARLALALAGGLVCALACTDLVGPPHGSRPFTPPARYKAWWALTESCSGLTGDFSKVRWYTLPDQDSFSLEGTTVNGAWYAAGNQIVLGDSEVTDGALVRHEMLHALLRSGNHPRAQFMGNCNDIVVCVDKCVHDGGGPPDTSERSPFLPGETLALSTRIVPDTVSASTDSGLFTVTIEVTNTTSAPGRIRVPAQDGIPYTLVQCIFPPEWPDAGAVSDLLTYYVALAPAGTPGATRRVVFDQYSSGATDLPRLYSFTGSFAEHLSPARSMFIVP